MNQEEKYWWNVGIFKMPTDVAEELAGVIEGFGFNARVLLRNAGFFDVDIKTPQFEAEDMQRVCGIVQGYLAAKKVKGYYHE